MNKYFALIFLLISSTAFCYVQNAPPQHPENSSPQFLCRNPSGRYELVDTFKSGCYRIKTNVAENVISPGREVRSTGNVTSSPELTLTESVISSGLEAIVTAVSDYLIPLAATSALTVALLEAFKKLFSIQGKFQRRAVRRWLCEVIPDPKGIDRILGLLHGKSQYATFGLEISARDMFAGGNPEIALDEFLQLTTGLPRSEELLAKKGNRRFRNIGNAVFELETARMMSQIQDAADAVLNNPELYPNLFSFWTRGCEPNDVIFWRNFIAAQSDNAGQVNTHDMADRYGRVKLLVRRQLDCFQTVTTYRWAELNQLWAVIIGAAVMFFAQCVGGNFVISSWSQAFYMVGSSALGGVLAPLAKDILNAISNISTTAK